MFRPNVLAALFVAGMIAAATPALADRGGNGNGPGARDVQSSIQVATVNGQAASLVNGSLTVSYGDSLTFATTVEKLAGWEWPMVSLTCYQSGQPVFGVLDHPDATFRLAGSSPWVGGDAVCHAELDAYGVKGGQETVRTLDSTDDWAATWPTG
jgi:hypothetical protein